ncbi:DNA breaking-rejoining enzyme, partial [Gymnopus androsaceus JB14]
ARRPSQQNQIAPSPFRPSDIPADRRVLLWTTPHSLLVQANHDSVISHRLQVKMFEGLLIATTDDTRQAYGAGLLRFNQFCDAELIPETLRMPASSILLAAFVADHIGTCTGKCIQNWLSGLRLWHLFNDAEWHGREGWLPSLKKAADRKGVVFKRPLRGPVERVHLLTLRSHLDLSKPRDAAQWAAATTAFWGCRRLGELLPKSMKKVTAEHEVFRSTRVTRSIVENRRIISFHLPWTKTTGVKGGECYLTEIPGDLLCPVEALENHFKINHTPPPATTFFAFRQNSSWITLIKSDFINWMNPIFRQHNLEHVLGHSFRIGGSLAYLLLGVEPEVIMKIGGWTSLCFLIYWRRLEQVIPIAIARAIQSRIRN